MYTPTLSMLLLRAMSGRAAERPRALQQMIALVLETSENKTGLWEGVAASCPPPISLWETRNMSISWLRAVQAESGARKFFQTFGYLIRSEVERCYSCCVLLWCNDSVSRWDTPCICSGVSKPAQCPPQQQQAHRHTYRLIVKMMGVTEVCDGQEK